MKKIPLPVISIVLVTLAVLGGAGQVHGESAGRARIF
jgi:hypothetical protein